MASSAKALGDARATWEFDVCPNGDCKGISVSLASAAKIYGNERNRFEQCTLSNTYLDFSPTVNGEHRKIELVTSASLVDGCFVRPSYNTWLIETRKDGRLIMRGFVRIEQNAAGQDFRASCTPPGVPDQPISWECKRTGDVNLTIGTGPKESYPDCPQTNPTGAQYCWVDVHLDAAPSLALPTPCLPPTFGFGDPFGVCLGKSDGNYGWTDRVGDVTRGFFSAFGWAEAGGEKASLYVNSFPLAFIAGTVPENSQSDFRVAAAWTDFTFPEDYFTAEGSASSGSIGGPLDFDFEHDRGVAADVYIYGYLLRKKIAGSPPRKHKIAAAIKNLRALNGKPRKTVRADVQTLLKLLHP